MEPDHDSMVLALLEHYERGEDKDGQWYDDARDFARALAAEHNATLETVAGIIAVLSPQLQWDRNKRLAAQVMREGWPEEGCLVRNAEKARRIWRGEDPEDVLSGPKVTAFYRAILGDESAVVLDGHMLNAVQFHTNKPSKRQYERCAAAMTEAAAYAGLPPARFQAVVWCAVRGGGD